MKTKILILLFFILFLLSSAFSVSCDWYDDYYYTIKSQDAEIIYYSCFNVLLGEIPLVYVNDEPYYETKNIEEYKRYSNEQAVITKDDMSLFYKEIVDIWENHKDYLSEIENIKYDPEKEIITFSKKGGEVIYYFDRFGIITGHYYDEDIELGHQLEFRVRTPEGYVAAPYFHNPEIEYSLMMGRDGWYIDCPTIHKQVHELIENAYKKFIINRLPNADYIGIKISYRDLGRVTINKDFNFILNKSYSEKLIVNKKTIIEYIVYYFPQEDFERYSLDINGSIRMSFVRFKNQASYFCEEENLNYVYSEVQYKKWNFHLTQNFINYDRRINESEIIFKQLDENYKHLEANMSRIPAKQFIAVYNDNLQKLESLHSFLIFADAKYDPFYNEIYGKTQDKRLEFNKEKIDNLLSEIVFLEDRYRFLHEEFTSNEQDKSNKLSTRLGFLAVLLGIFSFPEIRKRIIQYKKKIKWGNTKHREVNYMEDEWIKNVEDTLGHEFKNKELLMSALTTNAYLKEHAKEIGPEKEITHYKKLEPIGDSILDLIVTSELSKSKEKLNYMEKVTTKDRFIKEKDLEIIAKRMGLNRFLRMGNGEIKKNIQDNKKVCDALVEALIAAVYLDCIDSEGKVDMIEVRKVIVENLGIFNNDE